jgi:tetratricopeptide (TPR) repeat protein
MFASLISNLLNIDYLIHNVWLLLVFAFQLWMFIDAIRRREWLWAVFIFIGWGITALLYFFFVYRASAASMTRGFELPGTQSRKRIKELQAQIHHLDNAYHHFQLGDVYFQRGKLAEAEKCYRAALQRDSQDIDTRAHLGQCLLREKRAVEARPLLEGVVAENPKHDYGYTMMALAETLTVLGETDSALKIWQQVTAEHSYARAKVQLAELYLAKNQPELARPELNDVLSDDVHAPTFTRKRDRVWVRRAKSLVARL